MSKPRLHHFVQKAHLAQFSSDDSKLFVCAGDGNRFETTPKNIFAQRDLYSYWSENELTTEFEARLSAVEQETFPTLHKIAETGSLKDVPDGILSLYMAISLLRNPTMQQGIVDFHRQSALASTQLGVRHGQIKPFEAEGHEWDGMYMTELVERGDVILDIDNSRYLAAFQKMLETTCIAVSAFGLALLKSERGLIAIGDHPVTFLHPGKDFGPYGTPFGGKECELTFPISKNYSLIGKWQDTPPDSDSEQAVEQLNRRQAMFASRHLASQKRLKSLEGIMQRYKGMSFQTEVTIIPAADGYYTIIRRALLPPAERQKFLDDIVPIYRLI